MLNLVLNAVQAMPDGGTMTISTAQTAQHVIIKVRDTGSGMSQAVREHAFEPFFTTRDLTSTGLGLSQVYGFATQSGGKVVIDSVLGQGTEVAISLPMNTCDTPKPATVLVVDDEPDILDVISAVLESEELTVLCCADPLDALRLAETRKIDLLLTDIVMPAMLGGELAKRMQRLYPPLKVLLMTGYSHHSPDDYPVLRKPFRLSHLRDKIHELIKPGRWS
jgi:CheY-like chemotaxis protein